MRDRQRKVPTTLRLPVEEMEALARAAKAERLSPAVLARVIVGRWLEERGHLKPPDSTETENAAR